MKKVIKDGWHVILGYEVYVENGLVIRGIKEDSNGSPVTAYPYRAQMKKCYYGQFISGWYQEDMSVDAFRAGVKRGTISLL